MWRPAVVLLLSTLTFGQTVRQWRYEFKGDTLGMSLTEFKTKHTVSFGSVKVLPGCTDDPTTGYSDMAKLGLIECTFQTTIGEVPTKTASFNFVDGSLYAIRIEFPHDGFENVITAIRGKYGAPNATAVEHFQNLFGAQFFGQKLAWTRNADAIMLGEYLNDRETAVLIIFDVAMLGKASALMPKKKPDF